MGEPSRTLLFRASAAAAALAAAFHAAAVVSPAIARIEYPPTYPLWRHLLFILIDAGLAWLLLRRPLWLIWPYTVLTLEILLGHGRGAWRLWVQEGRVDWISVGVTVGALVILGLLILDRHVRQRGSLARS